MDKANKLRFYIDQAIMTRDYAALAVFEGRLDILEDTRASSAVEYRPELPSIKERSPGRIEPEQAAWFSLFGSQAMANA